MAVDLKLVRVATAENPNVGDLEISGRDFVLVSGAEALAQEVEFDLRWERGEWFLDLTRGVPWLSSILGKGVPLAAIRAILRREILRNPRVRVVRSLVLDLDPVARRLSVTCEIEGTDGLGPATVSTEIGGVA